MNEIIEKENIIIEDMIYEVNCDIGLPMLVFDN